MNLLKYDFNLPKDQIANRPKKPRGLKYLESQPDITTLHVWGRGPGQILSNGVTISAPIFSKYRFSKQI